MLPIVGMGVYLCFQEIVLTNFKYIPECVQCSSATDSNCLFGESILPTNCTVSGIQCFTQIVEGQTVRGCATEWSPERFESCASADHCETCMNIMGRPGCNSGVFPFSRARCHTCSATGNDTACATTQTGAPTLCPNFAANDRCFVLRRGDTFARGCVSSEPVCESQEHCFSCDGHGCNSADVSTLELSDAPGAAVINAVTSSLMMVIALLVGAQFQQLF